jgi:hypothetical protein
LLGERGAALDELLNIDENLKRDQSGQSYLLTPRVVPQLHRAPKPVQGSRMLLAHVRGDVYAQVAQTRELRCVPACGQVRTYPELVDQDQAPGPHELIFCPTSVLREGVVA